MKNTIRFFALLAAMMCFAACQPHENNIELSNVRNIVYTVDQNTTSVTLQNDAEWDALLEHLLDYAAEGSTVSFYNADRAAKGASKDVVEYSTTSREEMKAWMRRMEDAGMTVTVTYDSDSNTWHGMAYTTAPQPPLPSGDMLTYESNQHSINRYIIFTLDTVQHRVYCTFNYGVGASDRVYPQGMLEYSPAIEINTIDAFWLIEPEMNDTVGLYLWRPQADGTLRIYDATNTNIYDDFTATTGWSTYLCTDLGLNLVMHLTPSLATVYPTEYLGQSSTCVYINCTTPFQTGRFTLNRHDMCQPAMGIPYWGLTLNYSFYGGGIVENLRIWGEPCAENTITIGSDPNNPGCTDNYVFHRVN